MKEISEAKDVRVYKKLLQALGDYCTRFPATGIDKLFDVMVDRGMKVLPKDKLAINILKYILKSNSSGAVVNKLLNMRFSNLPAEYRPMIMSGRRREVAFWTRDSQTSDRIKDLVDFAGTGKAGKWTNMDGEAVKLIDMSDDQNNKGDK